jgi:membrane protease YdiL (CAAX protease family)
MSYLIYLLIFFLLPLFCLRVIREKNWKEIWQELLPKSKGWKKEVKGSFALLGALLIGFIIVSSVLVSFETISGIEINDMEKIDEAIGEEINSSPMYFALILIIILFAEEFFFRAFLLKRIGIVLSTLVFTFFHLGYGSVAQTIGVFFLGLILAYWFKRNNSIIQNYFGHLFYDIFAIAIYVLVI